MDGWMKKGRRKVIEGGVRWRGKRGEGRKFSKMGRGKREGGIDEERKVSNRWIARNGGKGRMEVVVEKR